MGPLRIALDLAIARKFLVTASSVVVLGASCSGAGELSTPGPTRPGSAPTATPSARPSAAPSHPEIQAPDIRFVLRATYPVGDSVNVRIENVGDVAYEYHAPYAACELTYRDASGRTFLVPPGTHCDMITTLLIQPGETKRLFQWDLDECTKDRWGCVRSEPLDPGTYSISGSFRPANGGPPARTETKLTIAEA